MNLIERAGLGLLHRVEPERAHHLAMAALRAGLVPLAGEVTSSRLACRLAGLALPNPVGLAAGFDKNAVALGPLSRAGFGFLEVGAVTPRPQAGNARPRLFRLEEDRAIINRFGFNNDGMEAVGARLARRRRGAVPVGLNLGANRDSADRAGDYAAIVARCGADADFLTVNVSSPNTERLRELQGGAALAALLARVMEARSRLPGPPPPLFVKIAPDLDDDALAGIVSVAREAGVAGLIATNTTLSREGLRSRHRDQAGGLSGAPLFERSTRVLARLSQLAEGELELIGVGGVSSAAEAYEKIRAGADAVQVLTGLVYQGLSLAARIARRLDALLGRDGFADVAEAVGAGRGSWL